MQLGRKLPLINVESIIPVKELMNGVAKVEPVVLKMSVKMLNQQELLAGSH